jgi:hypothetical protein
MDALWALREALTDTAIYQPATTVAGAMVQVAVLSRLLNREDDQRYELAFEMPLAALTSYAALAAPKSADAPPTVTEATVNSVSPNGLPETAEPLIVKAEMLLARAHFPA